MQQTGTEYYYAVSFFMTTFKKEQPSFSHTEEFKAESGETLLDLHNKALAYYKKTVETLEQRGGYHNLPFVAASDFTPGEGAAHSVTLSLIEVAPDGEEYAHPIVGEDEEVTTESREIQAMVFRDLNLSSVTYEAGA
ncbi:hypothetical protein [Flaviaesturariibacter amylovorans]|uniref:Uncharacterized protein n=1 Tax=Flaviaesturariibacter amylovorans TaxID=1084520 RepID=A0ABP8GPH1_9BACT